MTDIALWFLARPHLLEASGRALAVLCACLGFGALVASTVKKVAGAAASMAHQSSVEVTLSSVYPAVPTWWIPESAAAYAALIAGFFIGLALIRVGTALRRATRI